MIVDADKALARADGEETLRAARRQGYDSMHSAVQQERPGQIINREARAGEKRVTLAEAPPGFGRSRPRKDFGMEDLGQNLETLDDPWTRAIEVRGAVHRIDSCLLNSAETAPFDRKVDVRKLLDGAL